MSLWDLVLLAFEREPGVLRLWLGSVALALLLSPLALLLRGRVPPGARSAVALLPLAATGLSFALWLSLIGQGEDEVFARLPELEERMRIHGRIVHLLGRQIILLHPGGWAYLLAWPLAIGAALHLGAPLGGPGKESAGARRPRRALWALRTAGGTAALLLCACSLSAVRVGASIFEQVRRSDSLWLPDMGAFGGIAAQARAGAPLLLLVGVAGGLLACAFALRGAPGGSPLRGPWALGAALLLFGAGIAAYAATRPHAADAARPLRLSRELWSRIPRPGYPLPRLPAARCADADEAWIFFRYERGSLWEVTHEVAPRAFADHLELLRRNWSILHPGAPMQGWSLRVMASPEEPLAALAPFLRIAAGEGIRDLYWVGERPSPVARESLRIREAMKACHLRVGLTEGEEAATPLAAYPTVGALLERLGQDRRPRLDPGAEPSTNPK